MKVYFVFFLIFGPIACKAKQSVSGLKTVSDTREDCTATFARLCNSKYTLVVGDKTFRTIPHETNREVEYFLDVDTVNNGTYLFNDVRIPLINIDMLSAREVAANSIGKKVEGFSCTRDEITLQQFEQDKNGTCQENLESHIRYYKIKKIENLVIEEGTLIKNGLKICRFRKGECL